MPRSLLSLVFCASMVSILPAAPSDTALLVVDELGVFTLDSGQKVRVLGRYRAQVGMRLELEGLDASFELPEDSRYPALLRAKGDRGLIELTAVPGSRRGEYRVVDIAEPPTFPDDFESMLAAARKRPPRAQSAFFGWAFREAQKPDSALLDPLVTAWIDWGTQERSASIERGIRWLQIARPALEAHSSWMTAAQSLVDTFPGNQKVTKALRELDLIETSHGWRPRAVVLAERGLLEMDGEILTLEQFDLREEVLTWRQRDQQASLLRGRTTAQYQRHVKAREVVEGMERDEVVLAWGYPAEVTWLREGKQVFEGWFYPDHKVFFVDGWVFVAR